MEAAIMGTAGFLEQQRKREQIRARNEPPRLSREEERFNTISHGIGAAAALLCTALLAIRSDTGWKLAASLVYGGSMTLMMFMSSLYHAMPTGSAAKRFCRRLDYTSIFLLIGGTFAPILLVYLGGTPGIALFFTQWAVILTGAGLVLVFGPGQWRGPMFALYFLLGWSGVAFVPEFLRNAPTLLWFILMGGIVYTVGMIPFARKRKYDHCVWHLFVLAAALLHFVGIYTQIY